MFLFDPVYLLLMAPVIIFSLYAQFKVNSSYKKYSRVGTRSGLTGAEAGRRLLDGHGLGDVAVEEIQGNLTDHYDPRTRILRLSTMVYEGNSVAAVGIAAHEAGHAMQDAKGYLPMRIRSGLVPAANLGSQMAIPLFIVGLLVVGWLRSPFGYIIMNVAILVFAVAVAFQLITLPVEFNASRRALAGLRETGLIDETEAGPVRSVLTAAAMTYVAAAASAIVTLLYLILRRND